MRVKIQTIFRKVIFTVLFLVPVILFAQLNLKTIRKASWQKLVYRIPADSAIKFVKDYIFPIDQFLNKEPSYIFLSGSVNMDSLPIGHYLSLSVNDNNIEAELLNKTNLFIYPVNNQYRLQLEVRDNNGESVKDAKVYLDNVLIPFNKESETYWINKSKPKNAFIKVYSDGDTIFSKINDLDRNNKNFIPWKQKWRNFKGKDVWKSIVWLPNRVARIFKHKTHYSNNYNRNNSKINAKGFVVFNQPKYKQTDTVKLKAYIINMYNKRYTEDVKLYLEYYNRGIYKSQLLKVLKQSSPGSFIYSFPLSDTLPMDIQYSIVFKSLDEKNIISGNLKLEDYVLNEIGKYELKTERETYFPGDTMKFYATATDANNLSLMDAKAKLILLTSNINNFKRDSLYVPDTLYTMEKPMLTEGNTVFSIPANILPDAKLTINAIVYIRNSNNELHDKEVSFTYTSGQKEIIINKINDTILAEYRIDNKPVHSFGIMSITYNEKVVRSNIEYPFKVKIDPLSRKYNFNIIEKGKVIDSSEFSNLGYPGISFSNYSIKDSIGFYISNTYNIPVNYIVLDGNRLIASGKSSDKAIVWQKQVHFKRKLYKVKWQYYWLGNQFQGSENIGLLYKKLNIRILSNDKIYPGQTDTIKVDVKDYKNRAAELVNLTAVSYNSQFSKDIHVPNMPSITNYRINNNVLYHRYNNEYSFHFKYQNISLGNHQGWINKFGLDTMLYYQMLFPKDSVMDVAIPVSKKKPQLSVYVTQKGIRQEIYLLYINRQLVYYNGVTDRMNYSFPEFSGYVQIGIRLVDKYIVIDSIYIQDYYKHHLIFDLDKLPLHSTITNEQNYFSNEEKNLLGYCILKVDDRNSSIIDTAYLWQEEKLVKIKRNNNYTSTHIIGPFYPNYNINYYVPQCFDTHFKFETGYSYGISQNLVRLEKINLFPINSTNVILNGVYNPVWILSDTLTDIPEIKFETQKTEPYIYYTRSPRYNNYIHGHLMINLNLDSSYKYIVILSEDSSFQYVLRGNENQVREIDTGYYTILLVTSNFNTQTIKHLLIKPHQTLCINVDKVAFEKNNSIVNRMIEESMHPPILKVPETPVKKEIKLPLNISTGNFIVTGKVIDAYGKLPIRNATIIFDEKNMIGTRTNENGEFTLKLPEKKDYTLVISCYSYETKKMYIDIKDTLNTINTISLVHSFNYQLEDVIITTALGVRKQKKELGYATTQISTSNMLEGKVTGLAVTNDNVQVNNNVRVVLRGNRSLTDDTKPLCVIDGIISDLELNKINPNEIESVNILKGDEAIAIYGAKAANGVVIITTKGNGSIRSKFTDYAFWQPELFTDKNGESKFVVKYPDNVTSWETYVLAMDKKNRSGMGSMLVRSFKPIMAQLSLPQFLVQGDSVQLIGKSLNYTSTEYTIHTRFGINGATLQEDNQVLKSKESFISRLNYTTPETDSLRASFSLQTTTGFKDGEKRAIPVMPEGVEETKGNFWVMNKDTTVGFTKESRAGSVHISVQNNVLDVLLAEIDNLRKYPYYCMEQTTSKLRGLQMEKQIKEALKQPFTDQKEYDFLLQKIQKAQLFEGGWGWWESSRYNVHITNYILHALIPMRNTNPLIETNVRNGLLFLQNQLPKLDKYELFETLLTMSEAKHLIDYSPWLSKIHFDSLSQHQQWQWVKIMQNTGGEHSRELQQLIGKSIPTMLGGIHWGENNYRWYSNAMATTVIAFDVLSNEKEGVVLLPQIIQYFMENRKRGYWNNTVESASIVSTILPYILKTNKDFNQHATIAITGDTSVTISTFPYQADFKNTNISHLNISKQGGGLIFLSAYQKLWNTAPERVDSNFSIHTHFEKNGQEITTIQSGEKVKMMVRVDALKDADYVMIEIPIPAGCIYAGKPQDEYDMHKEYFKNKIVMFAEYLHKGKHEFTIELEPRYNGRFTLNPTKAELMYFPVFYGRNTIEKIDIRD